MTGAPDFDDVDEIAVWRAIGGERIRLNAAERVEAVRLLAARGYSTSAASERLGMAYRSVLRIRAAHGIPPADPVRVVGRWSTRRAPSPRAVWFSAEE